MKKIMVFLLALYLVMSLCACRSGESAPTAPSATVSDNGPMVGLCLRQYDQNTQYYDEIQAALQNAGYQVSLADSKNDQSRQDEQVSKQIKEGCQVLIVEPVMVTALDTVISQTKDAAVAVIFLDREPDNAVLQSYEKAYYIGNQTQDAGTEQAQLVQQVSMGGDLNGDGVVSYVMLRGPEDHLDAQLITDACNQELEKNNAKLLTTVSGQWELAEGRKACAQALSEFGPDIEVIFCNHGSLALGAAEAISNRGYNPGQDMYILAVGADEDLEAAIMKGSVFGTVVPDTQGKLKLLTDTVQMLLENQGPLSVQYAGYHILTAQELKAG